MDYYQSCIIINVALSSILHYRQLLTMVVDYSVPKRAQDHHPSLLYLAIDYEASHAENVQTRTRSCCLSIAF